MVDILLGLLAIVAGAAMLVAGQYVLRLALPIWGFFAGFAFGAGLIADIGNDRFLGTVFGWIVGLVFGVVLALLAYFFYAVAVVLVMASFGFAIGSGLVVALGIDWNWLAVIVGLLVGGILGLAAIFANMPMIVLVIVGSFAGAVSTVAGLMLIFGQLNSSDFSRSDFVSTVNDSWGWWLLLVVLAVFGIVVQTRQRILMTRSIRQVWYAEDLATA
jgi:hypothetical protein